MKLKLVEPLKFLFKDEVKKIRLRIKFKSNEIISRHPFPGPGLAIRMPGIITRGEDKYLERSRLLFYSSTYIRSWSLSSNMASLCSIIASKNCWCNG